MNWYKKANQINKAYHISNNYFKSFDPSKTAQGIIWFAINKEDLIKNLHGASINSNRPIYVYECTINSNKTAGWEQYDKLGLWELEANKYDSIILDDDIAVLNPNIITINNIIEVNSQYNSD